MGVGDQPQAASSRRKRRVASYPSRPGILRSIRTISNGRDSSGAIGEARRSASSPLLARTTSKPRRRKAFWVIRALMSLSSATRARRNAVGDGRDAGAAGGKSPVTRSNNERARTGLTSQPSNPLSAVCPKARRSNGENSTRLRPTPASRAASASWLVASGPSAQSTMTTSGFCGPLSASRPESRPRARSTLTPASASRASMA